MSTDPRSIIAETRAFVSETLDPYHDMGCLDNLDFALARIKTFTIAADIAERRVSIAKLQVARTTTGELYQELCQELHEIMINQYIAFLEDVFFINNRACSFLAHEDIRRIYIDRAKRHVADIQRILPSYPEPMFPSEFPVIPDSSNNNSGGCYIATAVYGSYDCPEVWVLRRYRDFYLAKSLLGRIFIRAYYTISPALVRLFGQTEMFKRIWKPWLDRKITHLRNDGIEDTPYSDKDW